MEALWLTPWLPKTMEAPVSPPMLTARDATRLPALPPASAALLPHAGSGASDACSGAKQRNSGGTVQAQSQAQSPHAGTAEAHHMDTAAGISAVEMPWWVYTASGMHLVFPAALRAAAASALPLEPALPGASDEPEQELQFDREVLPIGVSLADASVIGVTQRLRRTGLANAPPAPPPTRQVRP